MLGNWLAQFELKSESWPTSWPTCWLVAQTAPTSWPTCWCSLLQALNSLIWKRVPKDVFVGRETVEMGVSSAVLHFNDGVNGMVHVFNILNLRPAPDLEWKYKQLG